MAGVGDLFGSIGIGGSGGGLMSTAITMIFGSIILLGCGFGLWVVYYSKEKMEYKIRN